MKILAMHVAAMHAAFQIWAQPFVWKTSRANCMDEIVCKEHFQKPETSDIGKLWKIGIAMHSQQGMNMSKACPRLVQGLSKVTFSDLLDLGSSKQYTRPYTDLQPDRESLQPRVDTVCT